MAVDEKTEALINKLNTLNAQQQMAAAGVADELFKGVVVDKDTGDKVKAVNPNLTSSEETRYEKIFKILKESSTRMSFLLKLAKNILTFSNFI